MIICPNCKHEELDGAVFCSECGAQLQSGEPVTTQKIVTAETSQTAKRPTLPFQPPAPVMLNAWVSLHMVESGQILPLTERDEFTLGRLSENQPIVPDIDLSPYNAYTNGVSRLHAILKQTQHKVILMDLGSSNGTYLNGNRLSPHVEQVVSHGDILCLGKLKIQILLNPPSAI